MNTVAFWLDFEQGVARRERDGGEGYWMGSGPGFSSIGMVKSALLGRLMRGEAVRRRPCPRHRGRMWCSWGLDEAARPCPCQGTGWLPNDPDEPDEGEEG
jgi:hypothetical protein